MSIPLKNACDHSLSKQCSVASTGIGVLVLLFFGVFPGPAFSQVAEDTASDKQESPGGKATAEVAEAAENDLKGVGFATHVKPFLKKYCFQCHGPKEMNEGVSFHQFRDEDSLLAARKLFAKVISQLETGSMPPKEHAPRPAKQETKRIARWLDKKLFDIDCELIDDPGRVTIRRLNRNEYDNTIRDLLGVDFHPSQDFPSDDVGNGFDNIGDVLSLSPLLLEKYFAAAEKISELAIDADAYRAKVVRREGEQLKSKGGGRVGAGGVQLFSTGEAYAEFDFSADGEYIIRAEASADQAGDELAKMQFRLDNKSMETVEVLGRQKQLTVYSTSVKVKRGKHRIAAAFINDYYQPDAKDPRQRDRNLTVRFLEVDGPKDGGQVRLSKSHKSLIVERPKKSSDVSRVAAKTLRRFTTRAFRRPVRDDELSRFVKLVELVVANGETFERGIQVAVQGVLVSPHFLFRVEHDGAVQDRAAKQKRTAKRRIGNYELASRLSYFLWSTMPDEELFALAGKGVLQQPDVLEKQTRRMLQDPRSRALVDNFASQWLNLRRFDNMTPDRQQFPMFNDKLRRDMRRETELFFEFVMREDQSIVDLLVGKYTFVNQRLAKHYKLAGVKGDEFRKVSLVGQPRAGVLTQGSILTLTSNPERTSPVKRGKWILDNILGTPPPDPPDGVPELDEPKPGQSRSVSLRKQLEIHRRDPACATCHLTMDNLGFGFENFDAVGRWRDKDAGIPIDAAGVLPGDQKFSGPIQLVAILEKRRRDFCRSMASSLLTYALGRGLDYYDKCAVDGVVAKLERDDYRFSRLVVEIVASTPFRMRRGDQGDPK